MNTKLIHEYKIDKLRREELTRICWQYKDMKNTAKDLLIVSPSPSIKGRRSGSHSDPVASAAARREYLQNRIRAIETCAKLAGKDCADALLYGVITQGSSYDIMRVNGKIYCGKRQYYEMKNKFFWLLDHYIVKDHEEVRREVL